MTPHSRIPRCGVPDTSALPDQPDVFGEDCGGFVQRWQPGAFGDRQTLAGVISFQVDEDEWDSTGSGPVRRTIKKARILSMVAS